MLLALLLAVAAAPVQAAPDTLHAVDLYGLRTLSEAAVRAAIGLRAGDPAPDSAGPIRARLLALPGVAEVDVSRVCCSETGRPLLYVGIRETGAPPLRLDPPPTGSIRLPAEVLALGERFEDALRDAVRRGATAEDGSEGYALAADSALRSVQQEFLEVARAQPDLLEGVVRQAGDAAHRALAAQILAYAPDRARVLDVLVHTLRDPAEEVRNNAVRALALFAEWANRHPDAGLRVPAAPFLDLLESVSWTDRNKGVFALVPLTATRDPALLKELRARALPSLIEMARWTYPGHAMGPFLLLARTLGIEDREAILAWQAGERERIIAQALDTGRRQQ